ncbi:hypothetical protein [Cytobacillus firmus]|uniref:hypothetical protein n=1 Tax=Cytobacillus firmus TaxID=1399 RepID=UPI0034A0D7C4
MKKLKIYKEDGKFVLERINQFDHATKRFFITENGLLEAIGQYQHVMDEYELFIEQGQDLIELITCHLVNKLQH